MDLGVDPACQTFGGDRGFFHESDGGTLRIAGVTVGPDLWEGNLELPVSNVQLVSQRARAAYVAAGHPPDAAFDLLMLGNYLHP